jgi:Mrp family chromosome partitioning ATPase
MSASFAVSAAARANEVGSTAPHRRELPQCETVAESQTTQTTAAISETNAAVESTCSATKFAQEQIRGLIQRVFFPGWPKAARQVVISGADAQADTAGLCARIAREMATGLPGTVCAVEADVYSPGLEDLLAGYTAQPVERESSACIHVDKNLWLAEPDSLFSAENDGFNAVWLRARMSELRRNFDYTLIHAPAAFLSQTIVLGHLADGLILAIQAGKTHRIVAQTTLMTLKAAKVAVLGTVLMDRTFPIPEELYKRL